MTRIRLIVMAVLAVFCLSAVGASAASAAAKGELVNSGGTALVKNKFVATSGATLLETVGGTKVKCTADKATGKINSKTTGEQTVTFTGCTSGGLSCKGINPAVSNAGEIIVLTILGVSALNAADDTVSNTVVTPINGKPFEFECTGVKIQVRGGFYSTGIAIGQTAKTLWLLSASLTAKGSQNVKENEAKVKLGLETSINGGTSFEGSAQEGTEDTVFEEAATFV